MGPSRPLIQPFSPLGRQASRPRALRRASTLRPFFVAIRARKP